MFAPSFKSMPTLPVLRPDIVSSELSIDDTFLWIIVRKTFIIAFCDQYHASPLSGKAFTKHDASSIFLTPWPMCSAEYVVAINGLGIWTMIYHLRRHQESAWYQGISCFVVDVWTMGSSTCCFRGFKFGDYRTHIFLLLECSFERHLDTKLSDNKVVRVRWEKVSNKVSWLSLKDLMAPIGTDSGLHLLTIDHNKSSNRITWLPTLSA